MRIKLQVESRFCHACGTLQSQMELPEIGHETKQQLYNEFSSAGRNVKTAFIYKIKSIIKGGETRMPSGKKRKRHKMATHKRKKRLRKMRHKKKNR